MGASELKNLSMLGALLIGALLVVLGALGQRWILAPGPATAAVKTVAADKSAAAPLAPSTAGLSADGLRDLLILVDAPRRSEILNSADVFKQFVHQETVSQAVLEAAHANKADDNAQIKTFMARASQRVLVEAYLNQVVRMNLDAKFPSETQLREAYDKNPDAFRVPERVHVWQIFIPLGSGAQDKDTKAAWARADRVANELRSGKGDFGMLAKQYSAHEASRVNDGYMGLLKSADLLPPIAEAVNKLKVGEVSEPIASETGLHILKRGATVSSEMLAFERVKEQLQARMVQEATAKVRQAALEKIEKEYPIAAPSAETLEGWRQDLLKQATAGEPAKASAP